MTTHSSHHDGDPDRPPQPDIDTDEDSVAPDLAEDLRRSHDRQCHLLARTIWLNPVENIPFPEDLSPASGPMHGTYNTDKTRTNEQREATDHQFAGRGIVERDCRRAYVAWAAALGGADASLRLLAGLQAHQAVVAGLTDPGERVLLLPVEAGGHMAGPETLRLLGRERVDMVVDHERGGLDMVATIARCEESPPALILFDRSEGLVVEDVSALTTLGVPTVFDASQYLSNVLVGDHPSPFEQGFDFVISSLHKNFPGPQQALVAVRETGPAWARLQKAISTLVSNMEVTSIYAATITLGRRQWLKDYSARMLDLAVALEAELDARDVPVIRRRADAVPTHHVWVKEAGRAEAYASFTALEQAGVMTNYRLLPYGHGMGLRLGTAALARLGFEVDEVPALAELVADIRRRGPQADLADRVEQLAAGLWERAGLTDWLP